MSFKNFFRQEIRNLNKIVLTVDDTFKNNKYKIVYDVLKGIYPPMENAESIIISVTILSLPEGSN